MFDAGDGISQGVDLPGLAVDARILFALIEQQSWS